MIRIGIMGSIGSGKTFVAKLFKYPVFIADNEVRNLYKKTVPTKYKNIPNNMKSMLVLIIPTTANFRNCCKLLFFVTTGLISRMNTRDTEVRE